MTPPSDRKELADRLEALAGHYVRRAEILARYADALLSGDGYRPTADADADGDHQKAADLQAVIALLRHEPSVEEVAAIVDPWPFGIVANIQHSERAAADRAKAISKAQAIKDLFLSRGRET